MSAALPFLLVTSERLANIIIIHVNNCMGSSWLTGGEGYFTSILFNVHIQFPQISRNLAITTSEGQSLIRTSMNRCGM